MLNLAEFEILILQQMTNLFWLIEKLIFFFSLPIIICFKFSLSEDITF